ncbi:LodA/GoxA family CTQ-dependent oxidase [Endothiovibrio diazotrophicus]
MADTTYAIYPAIGIARVGSSDDFYIGPESAAGLPINPDGSPFAPENFRDGKGELKRQAARFHIYRTHPDGSSEPVTLDDEEVAEIRWTVHLANKKPIWYDFQTNLGEDGYASNHALRNPQVSDPLERQRMITDPGPRTVCGPDQSAEFDRASTPDGDQRFPPAGIKPYSIDTLGGLRTDGKGRLLVLGGHGRSGALEGYETITTYANNNGWFDDTSDGPVSATIVLKDGDTLEVEPAWVLVTPPSYAPEVLNLVSLYDTIFDMVVRKMGGRPDIFADGLWNKGEWGYLPSFERDIKPILMRGQTYPWVVAIPPKPHRFDLAMLGDPSPGMNGMRRRIVDYLRAPGDDNTLISSSSGGTMMPYLAGDASIGPDTKTPSKFLRLTDTQYFMLEQWANGWFTGGEERSSHDGEALTRAVLENCVGGAFSPGIEMTWVSRLVALYRAPFRIHPRAEVPYPLSLGWDFAAGMEPGDVTKLMAVPWQADFNECSAQPVLGRTVWWWPAQRPSFVYRKLKADAKPRETIWESVAAKEIEQIPWIGSDYNMNASNFIAFADDIEMVHKWKDLGFIYNEGDEQTPLFVEVARLLPYPGEG